MKTKDFFRTISLIHTALMSGIFLFASVVWYMNGFTSKMHFNYQEDVFLIVVPILALFSIFSGIQLFKKRVENTYPNQGLQTKLGIYQTALIIQWALLEGAALFSVVAFLLSANFLFMLIAIFLLILLFNAKPSKDNLFKHVGLNEKDKLILDDPEREIKDN